MKRQEKGTSALFEHAEGKRGLHIRDATFVRGLIGENEKAADTTGDDVPGERRIRVPAKLLKGGLLVLQTQRASLEEMDGDVVSKNFEDTFNAGTRSDDHAGRVV